MTEKLRWLWGLLKQAFLKWDQDNVSWLAAALSYYTIFSLTPLIILVIAIAGFIFGEHAIQGQIERQMAQLIGERAASVVQEVIESASRRSSGIMATVIGSLVLFFGASNVFYQLQGALNTIWRVSHAQQSWLRTQIKQRLTSVAMIFCLGFLLLLSLVFDALLAGFHDLFLKLVPGELYVRILQIGNYLFSFSMSWLLFGIIFKTVPQTNIRWRDVWGGAFLSAVLFNVGKFLLSLYISRSFVISAFGAAGSVVVIMFWFYYSSQILFLGAEFAQVYTQSRSGQD